MDAVQPRAVLNLGRGSIYNEGTCFSNWKLIKLMETEKKGPVARLVSKIQASFILLLNIKSLHA